MSTATPLPPVEELYSKRKQVEKELEVLGNSFGQLKEAQERFVQNISTLTSLKHAKCGDEIFVPVTGSVFTLAQLASTENVMVDIGTGYFAEKTVKNADEYYVRKVKFLQDQLGMVGQVMTEKKKSLQIISQAIQLKLQEETALAAKSK